MCRPVRPVNLEGYEYDNLIRMELGRYYYDPECLDHARVVVARIVKDDRENPRGHAASLRRRIQCSLRWVATNVRRERETRRRKEIDAGVHHNQTHTPEPFSDATDLSLDIKTAFSHLPHEHHQFMEVYKDTGSLNLTCKALHMNKRRGARLLAASMAVLKPLLECYK